MLQKNDFPLRSNLKFQTDTIFKISLLWTNQSNTPAVLINWMLIFNSLMRTTFSKIQFDFIFIIKHLLLIDNLDRHKIFIRKFKTNLYIGYTFILNVHSTRNSTLIYYPFIYKDKYVFIFK